MNQQVCVFQNTRHLLGVGDEMGGKVSLVHLHPLDPVDGGVERLALFHGDDAVLADLFHRIGDDVSDLRIVVGSNATDLGDLGLVLDLRRHLTKASHDRHDSLLDSSLQTHRVCTRSDIPQSFMEDCIGENCRSGGAVSGVVGGLGGDLFHHLCAHVLEGVLEFDLTRNGHTVFGDSGRPERFLKNDITAPRTERDHDGLRELVYTSAYGVASFVVKRDALCAHRVASSHYRHPPGFSRWMTGLISVN